MNTIQIDWLIVVIAAALNLIIGAFWYSDALFGPAWRKLTKFTQKKSDKMGKKMVFGAIASFLIAYFFAFFEAYLGVQTVTDGMYVGFLVWLGFVLTTQSYDVIWARKPIKLFYINVGYMLFSFLVMSGLIGA